MTLQPSQYKTAPWKRKITFQLENRNNREAGCDTDLPILGHEVSHNILFVFYLCTLNCQTQLH